MSSEKKKKTCFFVSPIGDENSKERKRSDTILTHLIKPVCTQENFIVIRVDKVNGIDNINTTIIDHLNTAELVIVDMTDNNPNCFFEFGYRLKSGLPFIPMIEKGQPIPFDVATIRTIQYVTDDLDAAATVKDKLLKTIKSFNFDKNNGSQTQSNVIDSNMFFLIQDKLDEIITLVKENKIETIQQIAQNMQPQQPIEAVMLQAALDNPENLMRLVELADKLPKNKL